MPFGSFINAFPPAVFLAVHLAGFAAGAFFAHRAFSAENKALGWGFGLYAAAKLVYMTYHLDWTVFLFAHTIAEVLDLAAFGLVFLAAAKSLRVSLGHGSRPAATQPAVLSHREA